MSLTRKVADAVKEVPHRATDFNGVRLEREMSRIEEPDFRRANVSLVGLSTGRQKEGVVAAPNRKQRRLVFAKVGLKLRIERDIGRIVAEKIKLGLVHSRPSHVEVIKRIAVRGNKHGIGDAMRVLPIGSLRGEKASESVAVSRRRILPVGANRVPAFAEALLISIAVLGDNRCDAFRIFKRHPRPCRGTVVEDVHCKPLQSNNFGKASNDIGYLGEGDSWWNVRMPKARQIGRHDVIGIR